MNAALDAIKQRHKFQGFHLAGQSGGSKVAAGRIRLRRDISCAVLNLIVSENAKPADPGRTYFDATQDITLVAENRSLRLFLVTDKTETLRSRNRRGSPTGCAVPAAKFRSFLSKRPTINTMAFWLRLNWLLLDAFSTGRTMTLPGR
jgi:hypothetical protein